MTEPNDMAALMAQAQEMKAQLDQAQQEIMAASVVGEAGNGLVKAHHGWQRSNLRPGYRPQSR